MSYCSIGVPILLREPISSRIVVFFSPVFGATNRILSGGLFFLALNLCPIIPAHADHLGTLDIVIVQSEEGGPYQEFSIALRSMLSGSDSKISVINADQPLQNADLVIAVGMNAAAKVAVSNVHNVLNVLVPRAGYLKLQDESSQHTSTRSYSAIYLDQPAARQAALLSLIFPDKHQIGVMYSTVPMELPQLKRELSNRGLNLNTQIVSSAQPLHEALHALLQNSEVLLALPDPTVYNSSTIRNILLSTYRSNVPLVGFSPAYVKAGALCALYSSPTHIATQAAALVRRFNQTHSLSAAQYPQEFEVLLNEQVARSLGVQIKHPTALHDQIKSAEREEP